MVYFEFAKKSFANQLAYRVNCLVGILNTCLQIVIFWSIYKVLYGSNIEVSGITFSMLTTNFVLTLGLSNAFEINDMFVQRKVRDGSIANELLRPVNFKGRMLAETLGDVGFSLIFQFMPVLMIAIFTVGIEMPATVISLILFLVSIVLGFFVLWNISVIVQMFAFWIFNVWSVSTIKNVFVNVLSGALFPLWFMPQQFKLLIEITPFSSVYFSPVQIYFGRVSPSQICTIVLKQIFWIVLLYGIGEIMWRCGKRKIVLQGG